ncbi:anthrone oxygenase family protein [Nocardiopsis flavescens]|uniref:Uncharacterized membrane protein n=1 Tax=Nocardiopsis flavescens TaxID=758803 RepID=A0A1M6BLZ2_9ACTN|nr:DUF1772 domain-containing protein [Nocardiopsis flavescens]SHI49732.1 Uncharacterized membrane protein [Nocardiopsis flavescens]
MLVLVPGTVAVIGSGLVAGVFFAVSASVLPAVGALRTPDYIRLHRRLGEGYHPVMPLVVTAAAAANLAMVVLAPDTLARVLFGTALAGLVGVQLISQFGNVPLNRRVNAVDPDALPPDWADPREPWRAWHTRRTLCAFAALLADAAAVALVPVP